MQNKHSLIVGQKLGKLTLLSESHQDKNYQRYWNCKCDCGTEVLVRQGTLLRKNATRSCGCLRRGHPGKYLAKKDPVRLIASRVFKKRYSDGDITLDEFISMSQLPCHYCGETNSNRFNPYANKDGIPRNSQRVTPQRIEEMWWEYNGLDRIDSYLPHNKSNCVPCCKECNFMKRNVSPETFIAKCKRISEWTKQKSTSDTSA